jgi:O-antigen ligase
MASPTLGRTGTPGATPRDAGTRGVPRRTALPSAPVLIGATALLAAMASTVALAPNLVNVALGVVAVAGLSREPRLGVLPAALLALIAVPYGRAADNDLADIAGIPLRFADGVVLAALALSLPALRHANLRAGIARLIAIFLAIGLVGLVIAVVEGNAARDILRDARWWALYGFGLLALWAGTDRRAIARGLLIGATLFSLVLLAVVLLPAFAGGLESRALTYDWGRLRLQFSNSVFLIPALAYVTTRLATRASPRDLLWLLLLATAIVVSVTRMSILAGLGTIGLAFVLAVWRHRRELGPWPVVRNGALVAVVLLASVAGALGIVAAGATVSPSPEDGGTGSTTGSGEIVDRILFQDPGSSVSAIEQGRFTTYRAALAVIDDAPLLGSGLGTLVPIKFTFGGSQPSTPGMQPGVDDAYLTVAMKTGVVGTLAFAAMMLWPLLVALRRGRDRLAWWYLPGWIGVLGLSLTQSFATTGYGPFGLALLLVLIELRAAPPRPIRA